MKKTLFSIAAFVAVVSLAAGALPAQKTKWHFPVHLSYVSGLSDIVDAVVRDFDPEDSFKLPIGLSFQPYVEFANGLGVGLDVGPVALVGVSFSSDGEWSFDDSEYSLLVPLGVFARYDFLRDGTASPYVRGGVRKCFTTGDLLTDGTVGVYGCVGLEFNRNKRLRFGIEAGLDTCKVRAHRITYWGGISSSYEEVKPYGFMASVFMSF